MNKRKVIDRIREELRAQFELVKRAADTAREDATDEESRARSKYETQGLEASYLAAGQAERAEEIAASMETLNAAPFTPYEELDPVGEGALVEVDLVALQQKVESAGGPWTPGSGLPTWPPVD